MTAEHADRPIEEFVADRTEPDDFGRAWARTITATRAADLDTPCSPTASAPSTHPPALPPQA